MSDAPLSSGECVGVLSGGFVAPHAADDAHGDAGFGACFVAFEAELAFEGLDDRFDDLAQGPQESCAGPWGLGSCGRAQQGDADVAEVGFERFGAVAVVGDEGLARPGDPAHIVMTAGDSIRLTQATAGNPAMQPGQVRVAAESPGKPNLLWWQIAGESKQFGTPYLICQPSALEQTTSEALSRTVGTTMHWHALYNRVNLSHGTVDKRQWTDWQRCIQRHERLQGLHTDPTTTNSMKEKYRKAMIEDARELQASLDEHGTPICGCSRLNHAEAPEVAALWKRFMPQIICDAMRE